MPNIMVFHNAKAVARFNGTERTLTSIAAFVTNVTGHCYAHGYMHFFQLMLLLLKNVLMYSFQRPQELSSSGDGQPFWPQ